MMNAHNTTEQSTTSPIDSDRPSRIFNPHTYLLGSNRAQSLEQPSDIFHHITCYQRETGLSHLAWNNLKAKKRAERTLTIDPQTLIISVSSAAIPPILGSGVGPGREGRNGLSAYGIYFGKRSPHNTASILSPDISQTSSKALLTGAYDALESISTKFLDVKTDEMGHRSSTAVKKLVLMTDSLYLVKCMTKYVWTWENKGYVNNKQEFVENAAEIGDLSDIVFMYESLGTEVAFWLVGRAEMGEARGLAESALKSLDEREWGGEERKLEEREERSAAVAGAVKPLIYPKMVALHDPAILEELEKDLATG